MRYTLERKKYGIGLAAPQVGRSIAIVIIGIKPRPNRPKAPMLNLTVINPVILKKYGGKGPMWEGCLSFGNTQNFPYALVPRYKKVRVHWLEEKANQHERDFNGLPAHLLQHEIDHLNGILFVDKVQDTTSYMTITEYKKRQLNL